MFTFHEKDNHKISNPAKMHLPIPQEVTQSQIFDMPEIRTTEVLSPDDKVIDDRLIRIYLNFLHRGYTGRLQKHTISSLKSTPKSAGITSSKLVPLSL